MVKKQIWIVESAHEDEAQIFEDWVPAETASEAQSEVLKMRDYATICTTCSLKDRVEFLTKALVRMRKALAKGGLEKEQKEWDAFLKKEGDIVRLPNGRLAKLDTEEVDTCTLCGEHFEPNGDSWDGLDPECADKVSEYMDKHEVNRDDAITALKKAGPRRRQPKED